MVLGRASIVVALTLASKAPSRWMLVVPLRGFVVRYVLNVLNVGFVRLAVSSQVNKYPPPQCTF